MPDGSTFLGWFVSLALGSMQVEQLRAFHASELLQDSYHFLYIMTVEWSEVSDVHSLEDILLMAQYRLEGIVQPDDAVLAVIIENTLGVEPLRSLEANLVVGLVGVELEEILLHATHGTVDAHIIIVEDDEHIVWSTRYIVESFES